MIDRSTATRPPARVNPQLLMAPDEPPGVPLPEGSPARNAAERLVAELREANERLVLLGIQLQELSEEAEGRRLQAETARAAAEAASHAKDEFLAVVSHELRTPLNAILGWTHMLRRGTLKATAVDKALATIERNAKLQIQLISDLLEVSQIITGKLQLDVHPIDLSPLVTASLESVRPAATAKNIALESHCEPVRPVLADASRVQQILWNLLSNALKFTPQHGHVLVTLEQTNTGAQITVTDSGVGIEPAFLPYVFDRFRQENSSYARPFGGLGLGLAIVQQLVELHGGTIRVESAGKERGATFMVTLPSTTATLAAALSDADPTAAPSLAGLRVLVVEDEVDSRDLFTALLQDRGADVIAVSSAAEGLAVLRTPTVHVVVADIGLPDEDGYAFIRQVRAHEGDGPHVPALAVTAYARAADRDRALASGYQMYDAKPIDLDRFVRAVATLARRADDTKSSGDAPERSRTTE